MDNSSAGAAGGSVAEHKLVAAHQQLLHAKDLQLTFTGFPPPPKPPGWLEALARFLATLGPAFKYIFWAGLAAAVLVLLVLIGRELWRVRFSPSRRKRRPKDEPQWRPEAQKARALLEDADALAAQGRFEEAVHLLLFRSIDELAGRKPGAVRPALTARDIADMDAMPAPARSAFGHISQVVERSFFGGRSLGRDDFTDCRGAYERFAFAEGWR